MNVTVWIWNRWPNRSRFVGNDGMSFVLGLVIICLSTCGGLLWLTHDVNERIGARSSTQSIAFQAARSGAQQVMQREREERKAQINVPAAEAASITTINALCAEYFPADANKLADEDSGIPEFESTAHNCAIEAMGLTGDGTGWRVELEVQTGGWTVSALGIARPEVG